MTTGNMTAGKLFRKTMPFVWAKLAMGLVAVIIALGLLAAFLGLGWLFGEVGLVIMVIVWFIVIKVIWKLIMHCVGYLIKAGHVAVIAETALTGQVPKGQIGHGKNVVRERFVTTAVYFAVDKLISGAVKQIQRNIGKLGSSLDFIPGIGAITGAAQFFVKISLGYVDECCLGWTFYNKEQNVYKSAADGVVLYAQNWKSLLKNAAWTMLKVIIGTLVIALLIFVPVGILFKVMGWYPILALLTAICLAWVVKFAVMDSYIMVRMMSSYMDVAPNTPVAFDIYSKLSAISSKFRELYQKGKDAEPERPQQTVGGFAQNPASQSSGGFAQPPEQYTQSVAAQPVAEKPIFCGQCGKKNDRSRKFCGECGAAL